MSNTPSKKVDTVLPNLLLIEPCPLTASVYHDELTHHGVSVHVSHEQEMALRQIDRVKIEAMFLSLDDARIDAEKTIKHLRESESNFDAAVVVLTDKEELLPLARACRSGATHFLLRPMLRPQLRRLMRSLFPEMVSQRRAYQRAAVNMPVLCRRGDMSHVAASVNLSTRGMLIDGAPPMAPRDELEVTFPYGTKNAAPFVLRAQVTRVAAPNVLAVSFAGIPSEDLQRLRQWVDTSVVMQAHR